MKLFFRLALVSMMTYPLIVTPLLGQGAPVVTEKEAKLPKGVTRVDLPEGGTYLDLAATVASYKLATMKVKPGTKYRLTVRARVQGSFTVEQHDRAHIMAIKRYARFESSYTVLFHRADREELSSGGGGFFLTRDWYDYVHVFRTPSDAHEITVSLKLNKHVTQIASVALVADDEGGAININPDFRYGELNYCGWRPQRDGRLILRPDGKSVFLSGYGGSSPRFPLKAGSSYKMTAQGEGGRLTLTYFDAKGKSITSRFLLRFPKGGGEASVELVAPVGCVSAHVIGYGTVLESFKVVECAAK